MCTEGIRKENKPETFDLVEHAIVCNTMQDSYFIVKISTSCRDSQAGAQIYDIPTSHRLSPSSSHTNQECKKLHKGSCLPKKIEIQI